MAALLEGGGGGDSSSASILRSIQHTVSSASPSPADALPASRKRKRPPMLEIPVPPEGPPAVEESPTDPGVVSEGSGWGAFCKRGRRKKSMEDFYHADPRKGFFAVFDGHGGKGAATYAAKNLQENVSNALDECGNLRKEDAIKAAFLKTDLDLLERDTGGGSCCVMALVGKEEIAVSNLGDCRAIMCRGGVAEALTTDHVAKNVAEQKRVQEKGGFIQDHHGTCRVQGILAVTRSFGDSHLKEYLSAEPDTVVLPLSSDLDFLVLASDGLWDKVRNQEVVDAIIRYRSVLNGKDENQRGHKECVLSSKDTSTKCDERSQMGKEPRISSYHASQKKYDLNKLEESKFGLENISPQSINRMRMMRIQKNMKSPLSNKKINKDNKFGCEKNSPPPKMRRITFTGQRQDILLTPNSPFSSTKVGRDRKFGCENKEPSSKISGVTLVENRMPCRSTPNSQSGGVLGGACEKVAGIALDRGSADDITIMVVDLKDFTCH